MFKFFKRLFTQLTARFRRQPIPRPAPRFPRFRPQMRAAPSWAANNVGIPFKEPSALLPADYFWKQDEGAVDSMRWLAGAESRVWRIYRTPINSANYR